MKSVTRHFEYAVTVPAAVDRVFDYLDDPARLGAHMSKPSWMMGGSRMHYEFDAARGRQRGAVIRLSGRILGLTLDVEEVVTQREPPLRKTWRTVRTPRLLIMGHYEMGFVLEPGTAACLLRVHITYALPQGAWKFAGGLLGRLYARWCVRRMADDAALHFAGESS